MAADRFGGDGDTATSLKWLAGPAPAGMASTATSRQPGTEPLYEAASDHDRPSAERCRARTDWLPPSSSMRNAARRYSDEFTDASAVASQPRGGAHPDE